MRFTARFSMVFALTTLLVWMASGWAFNHEVISAVRSSDSHEHLTSGRSQSVMLLQDGIRIYAEESSETQQFQTDPGYLPFYALAAEAVEGFIAGVRVPFPSEIALQFTSHDLVYPFHAFT